MEGVSELQRGQWVTRAGCVLSHPEFSRSALGSRNLPRADKPDQGVPAAPNVLGESKRDQWQWLHNQDVWAALEQH